MAFCTKCGAPVETEFCQKCGARVGSAPGATPQPAAPIPQSRPVQIPAAPIAPAAPPKKRGPVFWVLLGCLGLLVIGAILAVSGGFWFRSRLKQAGVDAELMQKNPALAVAKMMVAVNPDLEVLGVDESRGIIKVRDKKSGKSLTMNLEDAKKGKISFMDDEGKKIEMETSGEGDKAAVKIRTDDGSMTMGAGAGKLPDWLPSYPGAEGTGTFGLNSKEGQAGTYAFKTNDAADDVTTYYEDALKGANFEVQKSSSPGVVTVVAKNEPEKRSVQITITGKGAETTVMMVFQTSK
jgi:hypothetical protein